MKIGLLREEKVPPDKRVPLLPEQCQELMRLHSGLTIVAQPSDVRCAPNHAYEQAGVVLEENLSSCDYIIGIKEVPVHLLIPNKTYAFFSHTIKAQAHNKKLLQTILERNITLIDWEALVDKNGARVIAFGHFAGVVGAYNALRLYGLKTKQYEMPPAYTLESISEMRSYLPDSLPLRIVVTGTGRVSQGAAEILNSANFAQVSPAEFLQNPQRRECYTLLQSADYHEALNGSAFDREEFRQHPESFKSTFHRYIPSTDVLIAGAFWNPAAPRLFKLEQMKQQDFRIQLIADITCDIGGSIPSTVKPTNMYDPAYDFNRFTGRIEAPFSTAPGMVTVMAVDNLPCEVPLEASRDFGKQFIDNVLPDFLSPAPDGLIARCAVAQGGKLCTPFDYLKSYVTN
jgi:saccharopine dehydrogenase (NAD+, L-lysine-forming)